MGHAEDRSEGDFTIGNELILSDDKKIYLDSSKTKSVHYDSTNNEITISGNVSLNSNQIKNVATPTENSDATTKEYVDLGISALTLDYFFTDDSSDIGGYYRMQQTMTGTSSTSITISGLGTGNDQLLFSFATPSGEPGLILLQEGIYYAYCFFEKTAGTKELTVYWKLYKRESGGTETLLLTSEESSPVTTKDGIFIHGILSTNEILDTSDRIVVKFYANVGSSGSNIDVTFYMEGTDDSRLVMRTPSSALDNIYIRRDEEKATGLFYASENFEYELEGTTGTDIDFIDDITGTDANCSTSIKKSLDGHKNVLDCYDNNGSGDNVWYHNFASGQTNGTIEFYFRSSNSNKLGILSLFNEGGTVSLEIKWDDGNVTVTDNAGSTIIDTFGSNQWDHIRINFDCSDDSYEIFIGLVSKRTGTMSNTPTTIDQLYSRSRNTDSNYHFYFDAFGFSWDDFYEVGDNLKEIYYLIK